MRMVLAELKMPTLRVDITVSVMEYYRVFAVSMVEYYRVFAKQIKPLPSEPELSDFYHPSENQRNGELLFIAVVTGIATYPLYKYLK